LGRWGGGGCTQKSCGETTKEPLGKIKKEKGG